MGLKMKKWLLNNPMAVIKLIIFIGAVAVWLVTLTGIPDKVERIQIKHTDDIKTVNTRIDGVDDRVRILETNLAKNSTKTDMTLNAVYEIRAILMGKK